MLDIHILISYKKENIAETVVIRDGGNEELRVIDKAIDNRKKLHIHAINRDVILDFSEISEVSIYQMYFCQDCRFHDNISCKCLQSDKFHDANCKSKIDLAEGCDYYTGMDDILN